MYRSHAGDMGPISLVAGCRQRVALPPLLQLLAQERNWVRTRGSVSRRVVDCVRSPFFSGTVALSIAVDNFAKGCHVWGLPTGSVRWTYVGWRGKRMCHVGQVFPGRVYIDSNRRDSRI
jgi:hypothetical protein